MGSLRAMTPRRSAPRAFTLRPSGKRFARPGFPSRANCTKTKTKRKLELVDQVRGERPIVLLVRSADGLPAKGIIAAGIMVPTNLDAAQHISPEIVLDRAGEREDITAIDVIDVCVFGP